MKLVEVARKVLKPRPFEAWYSRRIEMLEPEEVARRMGISYARVCSYVWEAERTLVDHVKDVEDIEEHLAYMITVVRGKKVEETTDSTAKKAVSHIERKNFVKID